MLQITPCERRALQLLADQSPVTEIANCLGVAASDVQPRLAALFARMGVSTKDEAVSNASHRGLLLSAAPTSSDGRLVVSRAVGWLKQLSDARSVGRALQRGIGRVGAADG
jgi:DNA-binding CsgD family transcriptional regulator